MSVKPLVRWATFQQWTLRYTDRSEDEVEGTFNTPDGSVPFRYDRKARTIHLPHHTVHVNEHGWEVNEAGETRFTFSSGDKSADNRSGGRSE